jgi:8-oxo-dGTP pyrophosphatase MutT (NUDIX family)
MFKSTEEKLLMIASLEEQLSTINATKDLIADQYYDISKAVSSEDFKCKADISFSENEYIKTLANLKYDERSVYKKLEVLRSDSDVIKSIENKKRKEAIDVIKSLYRKGRLTLDQYNHAAVVKDEEGRVSYADVIVTNNKSEILLLKRSIFEDNHKGAWVIPGGHVDPDEMFEDAAKRELMEESGISVQNLKESKTNFNWTHVGTFRDANAHIEYYHLFLFDTKPEILLDEAETRDYQWIKIDELDNYPMVFNMAANVKKVMGWEDHPMIKIIKKAVESNIIAPKLVKEFTDAAMDYEDNIISHISR